MIVLRNGFKVYYPKLTIRSCLAINQLFGDVTAPLFSFMSTETQVLLLSLSLQQYDIGEDELYELMDVIQDIESFVLELYADGGIIAQGEQQNATESVSDTPDEAITFESRMMDLLQQCMSIGMREEDFYNSTLSQITRYVESHTEHQKNQLKEKAYFDYLLASLIRTVVDGLMDRRVKFPTLEKAYPFVAENDAKEVDESWEMEKQHLKLIEWANQMNSKFEKQEKE